MIRRLLTGLLALAFAATSATAPEAQPYRPGFGFSRPGFSFLSAAGGSAALRPQDVFATSLYTGTGAAQTITNGLDLAGKGGLVWAKARSVAAGHGLYDTLRGGTAALSSNTTAAETATTGAITSFNSSGFALGADPSGYVNFNDGRTYTAWSFRRAAKFFDVVTYTGTGTGPRQIPHSLGIAPGMIIVMRRESAGHWPTYHRSLTASNYMFLYTTSASGAYAGYWSTEPTASVFTVGPTDGDVNAAGAQYVAYLFAHDPDVTNGIIQCGSYTGGTNATVTLGWQPQFLLVKTSSTASDWYMLDATRTFGKLLAANATTAESTFTPGASGFTSTGFVDDRSFAGTGATAIYCAIRAPT